MVGTMNKFCGSVLLVGALLPASAAEPLRLQAFGDPAELAAYKELIAAFEGR